MANPYLAASLEADIKRRAFLTVNDSISEDDLLSWLTSEVQTYIASLLQSIRQEYLITTVDIPYLSTQSSILIPYRAIAQGLRTIKLLDSQGNAYELPSIEPERTEMYGPTGTLTRGYTLQGQRIILVPAGAAGTLRLTYSQRPSQIVSSANIALITNINPTTKAVTCSSVPITWTNSNTFDFCSQQAGFQNWSVDQGATISGNILTFTNTLPSDLSMGDYICLSGQSPGPQCPQECYALLCQRVATKIAESMASPRLADLQKMTDAQRADAVALLSPRVKDSVRRIVRTNGPGWRRRGCY